MYCKGCCSVGYPRGALSACRGRLGEHARITQTTGRKPSPCTLPILMNGASMSEGKTTSHARGRATHVDCQLLERVDFAQREKEEERHLAAQPGDSHARQIRLARVVDEPRCGSACERGRRARAWRRAPAEPQRVGSHTSCLPPSWQARHGSEHPLDIASSCE